MSKPLSRKTNQLFQLCMCYLEIFMLGGIIVFLSQEPLIRYAGFLLAVISAILVTSDYTRRKITGSEI